MKTEIEFILDTSRPGGTRIVSKCDSFIIFNRDENADLGAATWYVRQRGTTNSARDLTYAEALQQVDRWAQPRTFNAETEELTITTAPRDYDYGQTWTVETVGLDKRGREIRVVATPTGYPTEYQRGRYGSGLHMAVSPSEWEKVKPYTLHEVQKGVA